MVYYGDLHIVNSEFKLKEHKGRVNFMLITYILPKIIAKYSYRN